MTENIDMNKDFEEMRAQINLLREKLENQEIVNDKMLRDSMKSKLKTIRHREIISYFAVGYVITFGNLAFHYLGNSIYFILFNTLMMLGCAYFTYRTHRKVNETDLTTSDLLTVAKNLKQLKKDYSDWMLIGYPAIIVWFLFFSFELYTRNSDHKFALSIIVGCLVGAIIGGIIGTLMRHKVMNTCDEVIRQIEGN